MVSGRDPVLVNELARGPARDYERIRKRKRWCFCGGGLRGGVFVVLWLCFLWWCFCGCVGFGGVFVVVWWCVLKDSHQRLPKVLRN